MRITYQRPQYNYGKGKVWYALVTFLYVDILGKTPLPCRYTLPLMCSI